MKNKKIILLLIGLFLLTGCATTLKDENKKAIKNPETGQTITKNILCQPTKENVIEIYKENKVNIDKLPSCKSFSVISGKSEGLWETIFVKPLAWIIIQIGSLVNSYGLAIIIATILIRLVVYPVTKKTAMQSEMMKQAKPELDRLEKKYANKTSQQDQAMKAQEMMTIYKKYNMNPISGCLTAFIQLPLFFAFLEAINRVPAIFEDKFLGFQMGTTPIIGVTHGNYLYIVLFIVIIGTTYLSFQKTLKDQSAAVNGNSMKMTLYIMLAVIGFSTLYLPAALGFYWIMSSLFTILQNIIIERKKSAK